MLCFKLGVNSLASTSTYSCASAIRMHAHAHPYIHSLAHGNLTIAEGKRILPRSVWATWQDPISNNNSSNDDDITQ